MDGSQSGHGQKEMVSPRHTAHMVVFNGSLAGDGNAMPCSSFGQLVVMEQKLNANFWLDGDGQIKWVKQKAQERERVWERQKMMERGRIAYGATGRYDR